jgi:hypothetical protein
MGKICKRLLYREIYPELNQILMLCVFIPILHIKNDYYDKIRQAKDSKICKQVIRPRPTSNGTQILEKYF